MQRFRFTAGSTSIIIPIQIFDSSSTVGAGLTGLVYNTSSLTAYYNRTGAAGAATAISLVTATKGTWTSSGFVAMDGTNMPGWYELHIPDAALAAGAKTVSVQLKGATNMVQCNVEIELIVVDLQDGVRAGMTALPNAAAGASGGLPLSVDTSGRVDVLKVNGTSQTARDLGASVLLSVGTGTGQVNLSSGKVPATLAAADVTGNVAADIQTIKTQTVTCAAGVTVPTSIASPTNITAGTITTVTNLTNAPTAGDFTATMKTSLNASTPASIQGAVGSVIGAVGSVTGAVGSVTGNVGGNVTGSVGSVTGAVGSVIAGVTLANGAHGGAAATLQLGGVGGMTANVTGNVSGSVGSVTGSVGSVTGAVGSVTAAVTTTDSSNVTAIKAKTDQLSFTGGNVNANATVDTSGVAAAVDATLTASHGAGAWGASAAGAGSKAVEILVEIGTTPLDGAAVWVTTDLAGAHVSAGVLVTNAFGIVNFMLDPGTYYLWRQHSGYNFINPDIITVT